MKKALLVFGLLSTMCANALVINNIEELKANAKEVSELSQSDREMLVKFLIRKQLLKNMGKEAPPDGLTVEESITEQRKLMEEFEQAKKNSEAQKNANNILVNEKFPIEIVGGEIGKSWGNKKAFFTDIKFTNNSNKTVESIEYVVKFLPPSSEPFSIATYTADDFKPPIKSGDSGIINIGIDLDSISHKVISKRPTETKVKFIELTVLYEDGTTDVFKSLQ